MAFLKTVQLVGFGSRLLKVPPKFVWVHTHSLRCFRCSLVLSDAGKSAERRIHHMLKADVRHLHEEHAPPKTVNHQKVSLARAPPQSEVVPLQFCEVQGSWQFDTHLIFDIISTF